MTRGDPDIRTCHEVYRGGLHGRRESPRLFERVSSLVDSTAFDQKLMRIWWGNLKGLIKVKKKIHFHWKESKISSSSSLDLECDRFT
jgi:hypothetical protein